VSAISTWSLRIPEEQTKRRRHYKRSYSLSLSVATVDFSITKAIESFKQCFVTNYEQVKYSSDWRPYSSLNVSERSTRYMIFEVLFATSNLANVTNVVISSDLVVWLLFTLSRIWHQVRYLVKNLKRA